jgi:transposase
MGSTRKNYPASFQVKVALAAIKGDKTLAQLASEFSVHTNQIQQWKKRLLSEASSLFSHRRSKAERDAEELQSELYRQLGQLKVEVDWLKKTCATGR